MTNKELITVLISQHDNLRFILGNIKKELATNSFDSENILNELNEFKLKLAEHLKLEDETFYPGLLKLLSGRGDEIKKRKSLSHR